MSALARSSFFRLWETLEDDPWDPDAGAVPSQEEGDPPDVWHAPFGPGGLPTYRILDWDEPTLEPLMVIAPPDEAGD